MVAMYLDDTPNLDISASNLPGALSCAGITECIGRYQWGSWQVQGFAGDPDELWETVLGAIVTDTSIPLNTIPSTELQSANAAVSLLF